MIQVKKNTQEQDARFPNPPADGISSIAVNGNAQTPTNLLIATAWDNTVTCYEIQQQQQPGGGSGISNVIMQGQTKHEAPALCSAISSDNVTAFSGGCDGALRMWNVTQGPNASQVVGKHDAPIRWCKYLQDKNAVLTGSWDKTLKVWDLRQPNPAAMWQLPERCYALDAKSNPVVAVTADKQVLIYNLQMMSPTPQAQYKSPLQYQTRCVSLFADGNGFASGSVEGRIAVEYYDELHHKPLMQQNPNYKPPNCKNFAFKCHREGSDVFGVNAIDFHKENTFASAGSDGVLSFWDKDARQRLANLEMFGRKSQMHAPITDVKFSPFGNFVFYSVSYDWSQGAENNRPNIGSNILAHPLSETEFKPKKK